MYRKYQINPCNRTVGDCAVRAVSKALSTDWQTAYVMLAETGLAMCDMMNSNAVIGSVLRQYGFKQKAVSSRCPDCYTFAEFAQDHPRGVFVLCTGSHVATVIDGVLYDAWNSSNEIVTFYWYRKDD